MVTGGTEEFGNDSYSNRIVFEFILMISGLLAVGFFYFNSALWQTAQGWWMLGLTTTVGVAIAYLVPNQKKSGFNFNVSIKGQPILKLNSKILYGFFTATGFVTFFIMSKTAYRIAVPRFQIIEAGPLADFFLSFFGAIFENEAFFVLIPGMIFAVMYWKSRSPAASFGSVLLASPIIFMLYHWGVYGIDSADSLAVLVFGLEMIIAMILLRDVTYVHVRHVANNLGIIVFEVMDLGTFTVVMLSSWVFWAIVAVGIIALVLHLRKRRRG